MVKIFRLLQTWITVVKKNKWMMVLVVSFLIICAMLYWLWQCTQQAEDQYRHAVVLKQEQLEQEQLLRRALNISQMNAKELQVAYDVMKTKPPAANFTVNAPSLEVASEQVVERINKQDATLPPATLEKSDRTAVVKNDTEYKVDVLKINLDKTWELSTGLGIHRGDAYIPFGVQRNYSPNKALAAEVHLVPEDLTKGKIKTSGWEVKYVLRY